MGTITRTKDKTTIDAYEAASETAHKYAEEIGQQRKVIGDLRHQLQLRDHDIAALEEQLTSPEGRENMWWLQAKALRQRTALRQLEARNATLRFRMRVILKLHGDLTREEYLAAKAEVQNEQLRAMIEESA
jgi:hypothetical protein